MEVSEEVAEMFKEFDRKEAAYRLRTYRHKAYYSLDRDDGLEHEAVFVALSPHELYERKVTMQELHAAIASLPDKQAKRIDAHLTFGEYRNVFLTEKEYKRLKTDFAGLDALIEQLSAYIQSTGRKYADHAATLRIWAKRQQSEKKTAPGIPDYSFKEGESL